ncbi:alpha/beta fold hydrolase [Amycolatopsis sp. PS_44_ISF1]|uniref:alpha/beta hydrolase family protein n=1 Tax=Amycolatopsis sp. PS_44_ISF1 TaxID=2974917 RepID=UPI0028DE3DF0|nr:alpha/beta fold hydrolase [Amycolatopsis sp. PS_44_ISF1]MDT8913413.1 alpha/beta hydrolase [Amycolatopsis sp. PS_44_ISF1]
MITTEDGVRLDSVWHRGGPSAVVLAHGITGDRHEQGLFGALAESLVSSGFSVLRFSFRGHGESEGQPRDLTVAGQVRDLRAAVRAAGAAGPVSVVASSFGAVSTTLALADPPSATPPVRSVVLWQPVLDLRRTFLEPELPRGIELYSDRSSLAEKGFLDIEGRFELGAPLFEEFTRLDPRAAFLAAKGPAFVIHGDADEHVSHELARATAAARPGTDWWSVPGDGHGFRRRGPEVVAATARWLAAKAGQPG